ncbi:tryptophan/tyrosine permease [Candidatus Rickettsiella isopodorum]|jgi:tyrosine-specific transport protein|uniref:Tryptophan/tyrosine permease n=1 Tax=Candidatus Rickettsiella isopodorum TaxID=1225476 RepID=A0A1J8P7J6_9COXI|nr:aromatic amino acid transport family protein [Candidatus Rickettsiella isopodorum]OIZ95756.1 tryptophan/tyrosine permease [Candidatus Rickettsiella isopodorum]
MNIKQLGGILLITGNAIGGGMLAVPLATAQAGFLNSSLFLIACWGIMLAGGLLILEVNLWFPPNSHLISMARATLGAPGEVIAWLCYLLLLYTLLAAYIAGGSDFLQGILQKIDIQFSVFATAILFVLILGPIVYKGMRSVDLMNRILMGGKLLIFFLLILFLFPFISAKQLGQGNIHYLPNSLTILITSFGFAAIIPSLRSYFHSNVKQLRRVIILGSLIPLICYIFWNAAIMGVIPINKLFAIAQSSQSTSYLTNTLSHLLNKKSITLFAWIFTSICLATSFLGVGISLSDFLMDGLSLTHTEKNKFIVYLLTFLPPLMIVLFYPASFMLALNYAGIWCAVLLALLPALMAWSGRYCQQIDGRYRVTGGKSLLSLLILSSSIIIAHAIVSDVF